jgi:hypothetical protein
MAASFGRAFAIFCIVLGLMYGAVKFMMVPAESLYLAPVLALLWLGADLLVRGWSSKPRSGKRPKRAQK